MLKAEQMAQTTSETKGAMSRARVRASTLVHRAESMRLGIVTGLGRSFGWSKALVGLMVASACSMAVAGPEGAQVVRGDVNISRNGAETVIRAGRNSIINYRSFDIAGNESVRFIQPDAASRVLNRIQSARPTRIDGNITANGRVYIVNPAGVVFGRGAVLNVAGMYAAAGNLSNSDFVRGVNNFTNMRGTVSNQGTITADFVGLLGSHVENIGNVIAPQGTVVMASARDVMVGERGGNVYVRLEGPATTGVNNPGGAGVENRGTINAQGGRVVMGAGDIFSMAVRAGGQVKAKDIAVRGEGRGTVRVEGVLDASSATGQGGTVEVTGQRIAVTDAARVDASGATGGGRVNIGGSFQGTGNLRNSEQVNVSHQAVIKADATQRGNGGEVVLWSDNATRFYGEISAKGGPSGGDGGNVEVSGRDYLEFEGKVDTSAPNGKLGNLLLDPTNITVVSGNANTLADVDQFADPNINGAANTNIGVNQINAAVANVTLQATNSISIEANINIAAASVGLTAQTTNGNITSTNGTNITTNGGSVTLTAGGTGDVTIGGDVTTNGGNFSSSGVNFATGNNDNISTGAGNITLTHTGTVLFDGSVTTTTGGFTSSGTTFTTDDGADTITTGGGNIVLNHSGAVLLNAAASSGGGNFTSSGTTFTTNDGSDTITTGGGNIALNHSGAVSLSASVTSGGGDITSSGTSFAIPDGISIDAGVGSVTLTHTGSVIVDNVTAGAGGISLTAGGAGASQLSFRSGAALLGDSISLISTGGGINVGNATFGDAANAANPGTFLFRTNSAITEANLPTLASFVGGSVAGMNYTIRSDSTVTLTTAAANTRITGTALTLQGSSVSIGNTVDADSLSVVSLAVTGPTFLASDVVTNAGTVSFTGNVELQKNVLIDTTDGGGTPAGAAVSIIGAVGRDGVIRNFTVTAGNGATSGVTVGAAVDLGDVALTGAAISTGGGTLASLNATASGVNGVLVTGDLTASDIIDFNASRVDIGNAAGDLTLSASGAGGITFDNATTIAVNAALTNNTVSFVADALTLGTGSTLSGSSALAIAPATGGASIGVAGGAGTFQVTTTDIGQISDGFDSITLGDGSNAITVNASTWTDPVIFDGSTVEIAGTVTGSGNASVRTTGVTTLSANVVTAGNTITFDDAVTLGANTTLDSTNAGGSAGATITLGGAVTTDGTVRNLTVNAGTGDISTFGVGTGVDRLGTLSLTGANVFLSGSHFVNNGMTVTGLGVISGSTTIDTAGTGVTFAGGIDGETASTDDLTIVAGAGDVALGTVGAGVTLRDLTITSANDVTAGAMTLRDYIVTSANDVTAGALNVRDLTITSVNDFTGTTLTSSRNVVQSGGTGTTSFSGNVSAEAASFTGVIQSFTGTVTSTVGGLTFGNTGQLTLSQGATAATFINQSGAGAVSVGGNMVATAGFAGFTGAVTVTGGGSFTSVTSTVAFANTLALGVNNGTFSGNEVNFLGGAGSVTGTGFVIIQPQSGTAAVAIGGANNNADAILDVSAADLAALADGFSSITIGRSAGQHAITVAASSFVDPVLIRTTGSGSITVNGAITGTDNASVTLNAPTTNGVVLGADITTAGQLININAGVQLSGNATLNSAGGNITIANAVNATTAGAQGLTLTAGAGDITLSGAVGTTRLANLTVTSANTLATQGVNATAVSVTADAQTYSGAVQATTGNISLTGTTITLTAGGSTTSGGTMTVDNSGVLTIGAAINLDGAFAQTGAGSTSLNSGISTTNDAIGFAGVLNAGVGVTSLNSGTAGLSFGSAVNLGANDFTFTGDALSFGGLVDGTGNIVIQPSANGVGIGLNAATAGLSLSSATLGQLSDGFASVTIGRSGGTHAINVGSSSFLDPLTIRGGAITLDGVIAGTGNAALTFAGSTITLGGAAVGATSITTDGLAITFTGPVVVNEAGVTVSTAPTGFESGANIGFSSTINDTTADTSALTLNAGTGGTLTLSGAVGTTRLSNFQVLGGLSVTGTSVAANTVGVNATTVNFSGAVAGGSGGVTLQGTTLTTGGAVSAGAGGVLLDGATININGGGGTTGGGTFVVTNTGVATIGGVINSDGAFTQSGGGTVNLNANVNTTNDAIGFADAITRGGSASGIDAGTGTITLGSTLALGASDFTLTGNSLVFSGGDNTVTGTGTIALQPGLDSNSIGVNGAAGDLSISSTTLLALTDGFSRIIIGRAAGEHAITVNAGTFRDTTEFRTPNGSVAIAGNIAATAGAGFIFTTGTGVSLGAQLITSGGVIDINDDLTLIGDAVIDTTNAGASSGADITVTGLIDGAGNALSLRSGTAGDITLSGDVGSAARIGAFTIVSANAVSTQNITADSITQTTAAALAQFGLLDAGAGGIDINGAGVTLSEGLTTVSGGTVTLTNSGVLSVLGDINSDGEVIQTGSGTLSLGADITTTGDEVRLDGATTLTQNVAITTNDGGLILNGTVNGARTLTITAGNNSVTFTNAIGDSTALTSLNLVSSNFFTTDNINAGAVTLNSSGTGFIGGDVGSAGNIVLNTGSTLTVNGSVESTGGTLAFASGTGGAGDMDFGAGVTLAGSGISLTAGDGVAGTATIDTITNNVQFRGTGGAGTRPTTFSLVQDGSITDANTPAAAQFGASIAGMGYTLNSRVGSITIDTNSKFDGANLTATASGGLTITVANFTPGSLATSSAANLLGVTTSGGAVSLTGGSTLGGDISTGGGGITIINGFTLADSITLNSGAGGVSLGSGALGSNTLFIFARDLFVGGLLSGTGVLDISTDLASLNITLGGTGAASGMTIDSTEFGFFDSSLSAIRIGRLDGTGTLLVRGALNVGSPLTLRNAGVGSSTRVEASIIGTDDASIRIIGSGATTTLLADLITNGQTILIEDSVIVGANVTLDTTNSGGAGAGADIQITGAINADDAAANRSLVLNGGSGGRIDTLGVGLTTRMGTFTAAGASLIIDGGVRTSGVQNYAGILTLAGDLLSEVAGSINLTGDLFTNTDTTISTAGAAGTDNININGNVNSPGSGALTLNAGNAGAVTVAGNIGNSTDVASLTATGATIAVRAVTTSGSQTYTGATTLDGDITGGAITFNNAVTLDRAVTVAGSASVAFAGTINSASAEVNGLAINSPVTTLSGAIGAGTDGRLNYLVTDSGGSLVLGAGVVNTALGQIYGDNTTINANTILNSTSGDITFSAGVNTDGTPRILEIGGASTNTATFAAGAGVLNPFQTITVNVMQSVFGGNMASSGAQSYGGSVLLSDNVTVSGTTLNFGSTIDSQGSARGLTLTGTGVTLAGNVGSSGALSSVVATASGSGLISTRSVTTTGLQTYNGLTRINGTLRSTAAGVIRVNGDLQVAGASSIRSSGLTASDDVIITGTTNSFGAPSDLTIVAGQGDISFGGEVGLGTGTGIDRLDNLSATGASITTRSVRTSGNQLYSGTTFLLGNMATTGSGSIGFDGALQLQSDSDIATNSGTITFGRTVDSDSTGRALTVRPGTGGVANFNGAVGTSSRLSSLTVGNAGETRIRGVEIRTTGDQVFNNAVVLTGDGTAISANDITFNGTVNSDAAGTPRTLTLNTASSGSDTGETTFLGQVGGVSRLRSITTNSEGTTRIGASLATTEGMTFADNVVVLVSSTIDGGEGSLWFQRTLESDTSVSGVNLSLFAGERAGTGNTFSSLASLNLIPYRFGANVGGDGTTGQNNRRFNSLTLGRDLSNVPQTATAVLTDAFASDGRISAANVAGSENLRINTGGGGFTMGRGNKVTALGTFTLNTTGTARVGDISALGDINVQAAAIQIRTRAGGSVIADPLLPAVSDGGVDFVASGRTSFSVRPTIEGTGDVRIASVGIDLRPLNGVGSFIQFDDNRFTNATGSVLERFRTLFNDTRAGGSGFLLGLDLRASGGSVTNVATSIAGAIPRDAETREVATPVTVGKALRTPLQQMGIETRDLGVDELIEFLVGRALYRDLPLKANPQIGTDYFVTVNRLSQRTVEDAVAAYQEFIRPPVLDANGEPVVGADGQVTRQDRSELIKATLGDVWDTYSADVDEATGQGFRAYLESRGAQATQDEKDALTYLESTRGVMDKLDALGLAPFEVSIPKRNLINRIRPVQIPEAEFLAAVFGSNPVSLK